MSDRRVEYFKLVRDRIAELIRASSSQCETEIMSDDDLRSALLEKLVEEAQVARAANVENLAPELADLSRLSTPPLPQSDLIAQPGSKQASSRARSKTSSSLERVPDVD
jgi:predicted house-cleaning noncanonical NTP pyrophosphatase (MazG superfamily)